MVKDEERKKAGASSNSGISSKEATSDISAAQGVLTRNFLRSVNVDSNSKLEETRKKLLQDLQQVEQQLSAALEADEDYKSVTGWAPETRWDASTTVKASRIGRALARLSRVMGVEIKKTGHDRWNTVNLYHRSVIQEYLKRIQNVI